MSRLDHLKQFYSLLNALEKRLSGGRQLSNCTGRMPWPRRGIYFFKEVGENRTDTGNGLRIVRVGTHALTATSKTSLWQRLSQHRGVSRSGGGNHRGSIFRLIVGTALIDKDGLEYPSWDNHNSSAPREVRKYELPLEKAVSKEIGDMPFIWLAVEDEPGPNSLRGYLERNSIALLSNYDKCPIDLPSHSWLGHHCSRDKVRSSGLWNSNHVEEYYEPAFLDTLARFIDQMNVPA